MKTKRKTVGCYENRPYERTKKGLSYRIFYHQVRNSKKRKHNPPKYTKEELYKWITSQENFEALYNNWVDSNFTSNLRPSCDRLNNKEGYSFENIELVTWLENKQRASDDRTKGILDNNLTEVYQYSTSGSFLNKYHSINEASRNNPGTDQSNISACCSGRIPTAYGYFWSYNYLGEQIDEIETNLSFTCPIYQYNPLNGDILDIYDNILDIKEPEYSHMKVRSVIRGEYKSHKGFYFSKEFLSPEQVLDLVDTTYIPKTIQQLDKKTKDVINEFNSMSEASKQTGIRSGNISKCCNNKARSAGGFIWKYKVTNARHLMKSNIE